MRSRATRQTILVLTLNLLLMSACDGSKTDPPKHQAVSLSPVPAEYAKGEELFNKYCARCHGPRAVGTDHGPIFISRIYEPNHHGDAAFQMAAMNGVQAHHWNFGDMPRVEVVSPQEVDQIIRYVRWLQREAGIE